MSFYDDIIENLKKEAKCLNEKLQQIREYKTTTRMNDYISTLKSLRETLELIHRYDWKLMYSEYGTKENKQISIWEQNHEGQIKNHMVWQVVPSDSLKIDSTAVGYCIRNNI